ncbi:MAG: hypothetical protein LBT40_17455 [Deltaproteobacteria bacterium]|nr:hypothetical protein [Deltaproteobacteria bacterium]
MRKRKSHKSKSQVKETCTRPRKSGLERLLLNLTIYVKTAGDHASDVYAVGDASTCLKEMNLAVRLFHVV